jgi:hypothetical protein
MAGGDVLASGQCDRYVPQASVSNGHQGRMPSWGSFLELDDVDYAEVTGDTDQDDADPGYADLCGIQWIRGIPGTRGIQEIQLELTEPT